MINHTTRITIADGWAWQNIFIWYFAGTILSRFGSIVIEPALKAINFRGKKLIQFEPYDDFLEAKRQNKGIEAFIETSNLYRTAIALIFFLICFYLYDWYLLDIVNSGNEVIRQALTVCLLLALMVLFVISYSKQTEYVSKQVRQVKSKCTSIAEEGNESSELEVTEDKESCVEYKGAEVVLDVFKAEYESELSRAAILDNKLGITVAFFGAIALYYMNRFGVTELWEGHESFSRIALITAFAVTVLQVMRDVFFFVGIFQIGALIRTRKYYQFNLNSLIVKRVHELGEQECSMFIAVLYMKGCENNREVNEKRAQMYDKAVQWQTLAIVIGMVAEIIRQNMI